ISFPQFQGYLQLPVANYTLEVRDAAGTTTVAAYQAPLQTLGTTGAALTVLASGFLTPSNNSNGPAFGLFATTAGGGALIPLPPVNLNTAQFLADQIVLYPNPSSSIVNLSLPESLGVKGITITDLQGRTVRSYNNNVSQIDVSDLTSGMYMVSIQTETANVHKRILVD
ncbi:MAG: T9SS type A sorting domain-containing protein, partial [Flavobacterium sp.]